MPHHDGLPSVFKFHEEDTQPESQEHKALWDELELALWEDVAPVPAPVPGLAARLRSAYPRGIDRLGAAHCRQS